MLGEVNPVGLRLLTICAAIAAPAQTFTVMHVNGVANVAWITKRRSDARDGSSPHGSYLELARIGGIIGAEHRRP